MRIVKPSATLEFITPNAAQFIERAGLPHRNTIIWEVRDY